MTEAIFADDDTDSSDDCDTEEERSSLSVSERGSEGGNFGVDHDKLCDEKMQPQQDIHNNVEKKTKTNKSGMVLSSLAAKAMKGTSQMAKYAVMSSSSKAATASVAGDVTLPTAANIRKHLSTFNLLRGGLHNSMICCISCHTVTPSSIFSFNWYKAQNGSEKKIIPNARLPTYLPNASDIGHIICCKITVLPDVQAKLDSGMVVSSGAAYTAQLRNVDPNVKNRAIAALETGKLHLEQLSIQASVTHTSLQLLPLPSTLPVPDVLIDLEEEGSALRIFTADSDTPRGLKVPLSRALLVTIDPNTPTRLDLTVPITQCDEYSWYGDKGGDLWQFWTMLGLRDSSKAVDSSQGISAKVGKHNTHM